MSASLLPEGPAASARRVVAVVLAAGGSSRLGRPKPLVTVGGVTLLARALATAAACDETVLVLGAHASLIRESLPAHRALHVVENRSWQDGMSRSLILGLEEALARCPALDGVAFFACDQPQVHRAHAEALLATYRDGEAPIVASSYGGGCGIPAVFSALLAGELRALRGDVGARAVLERHRDQVRLVPCPGGALDVDTEESLARARRLLAP